MACLGAALPKTDPGLGSPSEHCQPHLSPLPIPLKAKGISCFLAGKTKHKAGRKCCSRLTPAPKSSPPSFHLPVATSKPPKGRETFASLGSGLARGWREEFGVGCCSPASSGRVRRHPGSGARLCHGNLPTLEGLLGSETRSRSFFPFPEGQLGLSQLVVVLGGVTVTQLVLV